ncbi:MAG: hypothetical protein RSB59_01275 [Clostridia bacterium]
MANETQIKKIKINGTEFGQMFADFKAYNKFTYTVEPSRVLDGTLKNDNIEAFYVPTVQFEFSKMTPQQYSTLIQTLNTKGFTIEYLDYEIMSTVRRAMYISENDLKRLLAFGGNITQMLGISFKMVSKFAYKDYAELISKATTDTRF